MAHQHIGIDEALTATRSEDVPSEVLAQRSTRRRGAPVFPAEYLRRALAREHTSGALVTIADRRSPIADLDRGRDRS